MKILISAYTVDPKSGGEPQMAWNWIYGAVRNGHKVTVITDYYSREKILRYTSNFDFKNLEVFCISSRKFSKYFPSFFSLYIDYIVWQLKIPQFIHKNSLKGFDIAHHTSWGNISLGSGLALTSIPLIIGPAGGGSFGNRNLRYFFGKYWITEILRNFLLNSDFFSIFGRVSCRRANLVLVTNNSTLRRAKKFKAKKVKMMLADAIPDCMIEERKKRPTGNNVLFVARFLPRKGANLAVLAFVEVLKEIPDAKLIMIGDGSTFKSVQKLVEKMEISDHVLFEGRLPWEIVQSRFGVAQVFLFPSLRDSSGAQVIESAAKGIPIVALDNGGIADWIDWPGLWKVPIGSSSETIKNMADNLISILKMTDEEWLEASIGLTFFAYQHSVESKVDFMNKMYLNISKQSKN